MSRVGPFVFPDTSARRPVGSEKAAARNSRRAEQTTRQTLVAARATIHTTAIHIIPPLIMFLAQLGTSVPDYLFTRLKSHWRS